MMKPPSFEYLRPENYNKFDDKQLESIENLTKFHIDSFDWILDHGLRHAIKVVLFFPFILVLKILYILILKRIPPVEFMLKNGSKVSYKIIVTYFLSSYFL